MLLLLHVKESVIKHFCELCCSFIDTKQADISSKLISLKILILCETGACKERQIIEQERLLPS